MNVSQYTIFYLGCDDAKIKSAHERVEQGVWIKPTKNVSRENNDQQFNNFIDPNNNILGHAEILANSSNKIHNQLNINRFIIAMFCIPFLA